MENNEFWGCQDTNYQSNSNFGVKQYVVKVDMAEVLRANTEAMIAGFKLGLYQREVEIKKSNKDT